MTRPLVDTLAALRRPTMFFIGVTTGRSSIHGIFPRWAERLGLGACELCGLDFPLHDEPARYRAAVEAIRAHPLVRGALVTTHKIDLFRACRDLFDEVEPLSAALGEVSSLYKRDGRLHARSVDPWTSGLALQAFLPAGHWRAGAEALLLGAGGAGTALAWHLSQPPGGADRPRCIHIADTCPGRLEHVRRLQAGWPAAVPLACHALAGPEAADALLAALPAGSLVVNATGRGKDAPGSPLTDAALFPAGGVVWELNYRGELGFLHQARRQEAARGLRVEDGWRYFVVGWTQVIADVFDCAIPARGPLFDELSALAAAARQG